MASSNVPSCEDWILTVEKGESRQHCADSVVGDGVDRTKVINAKRKTIKKQDEVCMTAEKEKYAMRMYESSSKHFDN